jgi:NAD(P)-dependent dehydrogenase (short-subunit alcohol dehydrogenase family)
MTRSSQPLEAEMDGRTAVVTGASSGVGAGIALALAAAGTRVAMVGRNAERLAEVAATARANNGDILEIVEDVTAPDASIRIVDETIAAFGRIDCLVPNAGVFAWATLCDTTDEVWDAQFATNVRAPFLLVRAAVPHMSRCSSIVFIGSNLVHHGMAGVSAYASSKGAAEALALTLAVELAPNGIRVNTVSPGVTRTPMTAPLTSDPQQEAAVLAATPVGRIGEVDDIAKAVLFLASGTLSGYVAGATLIVDGGQVAR